MALFNLFKSSVNIDTFEKELNQLNLSINKNQQAIIKLNQTKKSWIKSLIAYFIPVYLGYIGYLIIQLPHNSFKINKIRFFFGNQSRASLATILGSPVLLYLLIISIRYVIDWLVESRTKYISNQKKKQKQKITELKELTNYTTTNELLNKFDKKEEAIKDQKNPRSQPQGKSNQQAREGNTSQQSKVPLHLTNTQQIPPKQPQTQINEQAQNQAQNQVQTPTHRTFQDRLLDLLIGSEDDTQKYALICKNCFNHCGLAPPSDPYTKFICPYCKTLNEPDSIKSEVNSPKVEQISNFDPKEDSESKEQLGDLVTEEEKKVKEEEKHQKKHEEKESAEESAEEPPKQLVKDDL